VSKCGWFPGLPLASPYGNELDIFSYRVQMKKKSMIYLNKDIPVFCFFVFLFLCRISPAEDKSQRSFSNESDKLDSLRTSDRWLARDKLEHFGVSAFLSVLSYRVYHDFYNKDKESSLCFSCGLTFSLGLGKEIYDKKKPGGKFSYKDLVADILGLAAGLWIATR
jgi:putative lipoprotein